MQAQESVAILGTAYDGFNAGDVTIILDEHAGWTNYGPSTVQYAGHWTARDQISTFFEANAAATTGGRIIAERFAAEGDIVAAATHHTASMRKTGARLKTASQCSSL